MRRRHRQGRSRSRSSWPDRVLLRGVALVVVSAALSALSCRPPGPVEARFSGAALGTTYSVKTVTAAPLPPVERQAIESAIREALARVDELMSTYRRDSELSRLNRTAADEPFPLSPETLAVFSLAVDVNRATEGAFDPTVAPLVAAWGFGADAQPQPPIPTELDELRERVGMHHLELDADRRSVRKARPDVACDFSGIAKGYAVDAIGDRLAERGLVNFLVEVGGEIRVRGHNRDLKPWRVAIERPLTAGRDLQRIVPLGDGAVATSGDYRTFYERDGRRYSHTIDPRTGEPVNHSLTSVSVFESSAAAADAWATGLMVLGPERGPELAQERNLAALFLTYNAEGDVDELFTPAFASLLETGILPGPSAPPDSPDARPKVTPWPSS